MSKLNWAKQTWFAFLLCAATAIALPAQTFTTLFSFDGNPGANPNAGVVQGTDGNLYGTTVNTGKGCSYCGGTVFKITPSGTLTTLVAFDYADGTTPFGGLVQATNGNFYGTTYADGPNNAGTIFEITPIGTLAILHNFTGAPTDGQGPHYGLVQGTDGNLYGTTVYGGAQNDGTVFEITPSGTLTTLYSFCSQGGCTDGNGPQGGLVQASDGNFYGTTTGGGANGDGTVFKITPGGTLTTLHSFDGTDGASPWTVTLVEATDGNFYGTATGGGADGDGTVFKITPSGTLTTLYSFCSQSGCMDGSSPLNGLVQATDGNFYGTTAAGGANGEGTVFKITPSGALTILNSVGLGALVQDTNGILYGTTYHGGANGYGTVFSLSVGLGPFVEPQTTSGKVGSLVKILGTDLTGATSVTFNSTPAFFGVRSNSLIGAVVPPGATTGTVRVVTPGGTLSSNVPFRVQP